MSELKEQLLARSSRVEDIERLKADFNEQKREIKTQNEAELESLRRYVSTSGRVEARRLLVSSSITVGRFTNGIQITHCWWWIGLRFPLQSLFYFLRYFEQRLQASEESYREEIALLQLRLVESALEESVLKTADSRYVSVNVQ